MENFKTNKLISEKLQDKLLKKFEDPFYGLENLEGVNAIFNYPTYFDNGDYIEEIEEETNFLLSKKDWLKKQGYKGNIYFGDYFLKI